VPVVATSADALDLKVINGMLRQGVMESKRGTVRESWRAESALIRSWAAIRRADADAHKVDTRERVVARRQRTRRLIELGGLVIESGLVQFSEADCATLHCALLDPAARAQSDDEKLVLALWKRRGKREFEAEAETAEKSGGGRG
jgi:Conjugal transfer protein TraD